MACQEVLAEGYPCLAAVMSFFVAGALWAVTGFLWITSSHDDEARAALKYIALIGALFVALGVYFYLAGCK